MCVVSSSHWWFSGKIGRCHLKIFGSRMSASPGFDSRPMQLRVTIHLLPFPTTSLSNDFLGLLILRGLCNRDGVKAQRNESQGRGKRRSRYDPVEGWDRGLPNLSYRKRRQAATGCTRGCVRTYKSLHKTLYDQQAVSMCAFHYVPRPHSLESWNNTFIAFSHASHGRSYVP
jgi:hypothetical protein